MLTNQVLLSDELIQAARTHSRRERLRPGRRLEQGLGSSAFETGGTGHRAQSTGRPSRGASRVGRGPANRSGRPSDSPLGRRHHRVVGVVPAAGDVGLDLRDHPGLRCSGTPPGPRSGRRPGHAARRSPGRSPRSHLASSGPGRGPPRCQSPSHDDDLRTGPGVWAADRCGRQSVKRCIPFTRTSRIARIRSNEPPTMVIRRMSRRT